jgi:hypothetical protein
MARVKTNSTILDKASMRLQGMKAINATFDLGSGLSVTAIEAALNEARLKQDAFNHQVSILEEKQAEFEDAEKVLNDLTTRVLAGVAAKFGKDSVEYAQVGGTRSRDRKRSVRKSKSSAKPAS